MWRSGEVIPRRWYCEAILKTDLSGNCEDGWHFCYAFLRRIGIISQDPSSGVKFRLIELGNYTTCERKKNLTANGCAIVTRQVQG